MENKEKSEKHSKWDFDPPPMDIMRFIDFPTPREHPPSKPSECNSERNARKYDDEYFWDNLSEEQFKELDAQIEDIERNRTDHFLAVQLSKLLYLQITQLNIQKGSQQELKRQHQLQPMVYNLLPALHTHLRINLRPEGQHDQGVLCRPHILIMAEMT